MSYKFQRLRERLRAAVAAGELAGKLPGERALAKRFHVNAKTLSKALTDLAAEGLLDRSIGRGTFVKGAGPAPAAARGRWLVLCDPADATGPFVKRLAAANADTVVWTNPVGAVRPSFLNGVGAVVSLTESTPPAFLRDLVVRNISVVAVDRLPRTYSTHAVVVDRATAVSHVARELVLGGHRRLAVVEEKRSGGVAAALRQAVARLAPDATVDALDAADVPALADHGASAVVCDAPATARAVRAAVAALGWAVPGRVTIMAVGAVDGADAAPCSGFYADEQQKVDAVAALLRDPPARPATLWLAGRFVDAGTTTTAGATDHGTAAVDGESTLRLPRLAIA